MLVHVEDVGLELACSTGTERLAAEAADRPAAAARPGLRHGRPRTSSLWMARRERRRRWPAGLISPSTRPSWDILGVNFYPWSNRRIVRAPQRTVAFQVRPDALGAGRRPADGPRPLRPADDGHRDQQRRLPTRAGAVDARDARGRPLRQVRGRAGRRLHLVPALHDDRVEVPLVAEGPGGSPAPPRPVRGPAARRGHGPPRRRRWSRRTAATSRTPRARSASASGRRKWRPSSWSPEDPNPPKSRICGSERMGLALAFPFHREG